MPAPPTRSDVTVDGRTLQVSNLDKPLYPTGFTKGQVIDYYIRIAPVLLPHLRERREDVELLAEHFLAQLNKEHGTHKDLARSAVARLRTMDYVTDGRSWFFNFGEKGGKLHQVPVRHDLQLQMEQYLRAAGLEGRSDKTPLFRTARKKKKERELSDRGLNGNDLLRIVKRRLVGAGLPEGAFCCHSFRATTATNLLKVVPAAALDRVLTRRRLAVAMEILASEPAAFAAIHHAVNPIRARVLPARQR